MQHAHGFKHSFIVHSHRYSHLRKFVYEIPNTKASPFKSLVDAPTSNQITFLHPISFLASGSGFIPDDLALEARDCATLFAAIEKCADRPEEVEELRPSVFFSGKRTNPLLQQKDIISYEQALKGKVKEWIAKPDFQASGSLYMELLDQFVSPDSKGISSQDPAFLRNLVHLVSELHHGGDLVNMSFHRDKLS